MPPENQDLKDALLDAIERSHPGYAEAVTEAIEGIPDPSIAQPALTADEFAEWLAQL